MGIPDIIIAKGEEILQMIPQRPPMVMVHRLHHAKDGNTLSSFKIEESNIFVRDGKLEEPGIIENIAQTAAVGVGYQFKNEGSEIPTGYIGAVQSLKIHNLPNVNNDIVTEVTVEHEIFNTTLINSKVSCNEVIIAECKMKIFLDK